MPQLQRRRETWQLEGGAAAHVMDLETAVKDGILGGCAAGGAPAAAVAEKLDLKTMIEDLHLPDLLEPMVDPVTLSTGQTYERSNILRWFSMGHLTCPTTMQELWDDGGRRLLLKKRSEDVHGRAEELLAALRRAKGQSSRSQVLSELLQLVSSHASAKKTVANSGGIALISELLGPFTSHAVGSHAIAILVLLPLDSQALQSLMEPAKISLVVDILNEGFLETKMDCVKLIGLLMEEEGFRPEIVSSLSLLVGLLRLVKDRRHLAGVNAGLILLKAMSCHQQLRSSMVTVGAVPLLVELLLLQILTLLSAMAEGAASIKDCPAAIPNLVRLLMRVTETCTESALSILWNICRSAPEECAPRSVEAGLAAKLLLVIQSGCSPAVKQRSAELLKLCSLNYTTAHFISKCKLTRTIQ
ncbi:unnamed protein product [Spirodela intermedia]|uniref:U-box domain-containing protein n=1 Tax=Spirodela intermedia TaxID=51605 RepID=A0A7I8JBI8_SPIIN|nr:unnamed protein product [Spirodela intermedia]CAA6667464.1 unnamed protein product [Spirodela intermedia]